ncbi:MAG: carbamoyltransferase HypF, partial [Candidatus Fermentibacteraceae bacterium]|nr:carbamoyltransferase HypF [Candidatus Fermentibacteraceae bacterium]
PRAPIVLLRKGGVLPMEEAVSELVAPGNSELGVMLPYTPLHLLLMKELGRPVVATSGNLADEPICTDEREALIRLSGLADLFLVHDRPIARHVDDSIIRIFRGGEMVLRRARGYAPLPLGSHMMGSHCPGRSVLATGAHLKNTLALSVGSNIFVSQHIGDLETPQAMNAFDEVRNSIEELYRASPSMAACDMHPDYLSSVRARESGLEVYPVQHHEAHIYSCMLDSGARPPLLGVAWDGTGYGPDGTIWGGEFFRFRADGAERVARFRQFRLPGGEAAVKEPRRSALGALRQLLDDPASVLLPGTFTEGELMTLYGMMDGGLNSPLTSSVGRLFDAVASILGLRQRLEFEAQAAMELEHCIKGLETDDTYPFLLEEDMGLMIVDWAPMILGILEDRDKGLDTGLISAKFHNTLSGVVVRISEETGEKQVLLSGGCFQNSYLLERTCAALERTGFKPVVHHQLPSNDGGIAPGQVLAALMNLDED